MPLKIRVPLVCLCLLALSLVSARGQEYRNLVNTRFNTVASGPMQAVIVDVPNVKDERAVRQAVAHRLAAVRRDRNRALQQQLAFLQKFMRWSPDLTLGYGDVVIVRQNGRLALPTPRTRGRAGNNLTFTFPTPVDTAGNGSWTPAQQNELQAIINIVYPVLKEVYGEPSWSGEVKVVNGDNLPSIIGDPDALSGGVYNASTHEITFAVYNAPQSRVLNLTQMMALAFRGSASISYDVWERGMARAATLRVLSDPDVLRQFRTLFGGDLINLADPLWHALDRYELLNQPPLGNDRFYPVSKSGGQANTPSFPNMLAPRLMMSGSVWLKVLTESPNFLSVFNARYYQALSGSPNLKNNVPALKQIAKEALAANGVNELEGKDVFRWFEENYILDTSVSPGAKLYALVSPLRPDRASDDDFGVAVVLYYYRTTFDAASNSNEINLNGVCYPIYWDFAFQNRLFLGAQYERVDIRDGVGAVAPTFFNTIGGDPTDEGRMRITIDFPVNFETARVVVAPRSMGKVGSVNNFWGTVIGADTGKMKIEADGIASVELNVRQGAFGGQVDPAIFSRPRRATLTFTNAVGLPTTRRVVIGYNEYATIFHVNSPVDVRTHTFEAGPQMVAFPIQPLQSKAAQALLNPANDLPIFNEGNLLMAQWRQNVLGADKYQLYPNLDPLQPGKGYWASFPAQTPVKLVGRLPSPGQDVTLGLLFGWNQIGNPYETPININTLQFQYLADNVPVGLQEAIGRGWIVAQDFQISPGNVVKAIVWDYHPATGYSPVTTLEPWKGYFVRVGVTEGVSITYPNPSRAGRAPSVSRAAPTVSDDPGAWAIPLTVRDPNGRGATAYLGHSSRASAGFDARLDALRPPDFSRSAPALAFSHPDWGANAGDYFSDIRRPGTREPWELTVYTPEPEKTYTLSWGNLSGVPRSTQLVLVDVATGRRQYLQGASGYSFQSGNAPIRRFQIVAEERGRTALRIMRVQARVSRAVGGRTVEIAFDLSQGATVTTQIRGGNGQIVRRLSPGRASGAGTNSLIWDMRDDRAISVPSGTYLVEITASTPEGDFVRVVQPLTIVR